MAVLTASVTGSAGVIAGEELFTEGVWADLGRDGIVQDYVGTAWRATATGSNTNVTIGTADNVAEVRGFRCRLTAPETVALGSIGTQPTGSNQRVSRIVLRLERTTYTASIVAIPGAVASAATAPAVVQNADTWDLPICRVIQRGAAAITQTDITDERVWTSDYAEVSEAGQLLGPVGSVRARGNLHYRRQPVLGTSSSWQIEAGGLPDPARAWSWGASVYNFTVQSAGWVTPPGASRSYVCQAGHLYQITSQYTLQKSEDVETPMRHAIFIGGSELVETYSTHRLGANSASIVGWYRAPASGTYTFSTRFAGGPVRVFTRYQSPRTDLIDLGYRAS